MLCDIINITYGAKYCDILRSFVQHYVNFRSMLVHTIPLVWDQEASQFPFPEEFRESSFWGIREVSHGVQKSSD